MTEWTMQFYRLPPKDKWHVAHPNVTGTRAEAIAKAQNYWRTQLVEEFPGEALIVQIREFKNGGWGPEIMVPKPEGV